MNLVVCSREPLSACDRGSTREGKFHFVEMSLADFDFPGAESEDLRREPLYRIIVRVPGDQLDELDAVMRMVSFSDHDLSRSCAMRAALGMWLAIAKTTDPAIVVEALQKAHLPRGRKGRGQ